MVKSKGYSLIYTPKLIPISIEVTMPQFVDFGASIQRTWSSCCRSSFHLSIPFKPSSFLFMGSVHLDFKCSSPILVTDFAVTFYSNGIFFVVKTSDLTLSNLNNFICLSESCSQLLLPYFRVSRPVRM